MAPPTRHSLDDPIRQHQKFQRQVVDIQSFVIELHDATSVTRLASCLSQRRLRGQLPAARACLARAKKPGLLAKNTADGDLRTIGHGHGHGHVYAETAAFRDTRLAPDAFQ
jgi:hypothetical protein